MIGLVFGGEKEKNFLHYLAYILPVIIESHGLNICYMVSLNILNIHQKTPLFEDPNYHSGISIFIRLQLHMDI